MSTTGNGQGGNGNQQITEAVSADSEVGSAVSGKIAPPPGQQKKADFVSDQEVRWCPGCGDYAILNNVQKVMPELGIPREKIENCVVAAAGTPAHLDRKSTRLNSSHLVISYAVFC